MSKNFDFDKHVFISDVVTPPDNLFGTVPNRKFKPGNPKRLNVDGEPMDVIGEK